MPGRELSRAGALALLGVVLAGCGPAAEIATEPGRERPNVLLVLLDDVGPEGLSCYASDGPAATPRMDALAARGVRFTNAWAMPLCSPTRAALQTGRFGFRTGIGTLVGLRDEVALPEDEVLLPELLDRGTGGRYAHAAFGKWHLGTADGGRFDSATRAGYGHFEGALLRGDAPYFDWPALADGRRSRRTGYLTEATVEDARTWIAAQGGPWFCYLALHAPHAPLHRPPEHLAAVESDRPSERELYGAMIEAADLLLGRLLDDVDPETTLVLLLGDNGPLATLLPGAETGPDGRRPRAEQDRRGKGTLYEGGLRVPFVVAGPGVAGGRTSDALVHVVDVLATVAEAAGVDAARAVGGAPLDARSLWPLLRGEPGPGPRELNYSEVFRPNGPGPHEEHSRAVRGARFKLIANADGSEELYDLRADPGETTNLVASDDEAAREAHALLRAALDTRFAR